MSEVSEYLVLIGDEGGPSRYKLEELAHESHVVSRKRDIPVSLPVEVFDVLMALRRESFTGSVRIDMSQGGFSHLMTEECIRLVPNSEHS